MYSNEDPTQPKINKINKFKKVCWVKIAIEIVSNGILYSNENEKSLCAKIWIKKYIRHDSSDVTGFRSLNNITSSNSLLLACLPLWRLHSHVASSPCDKGGP